MSGGDEAVAWIALSRLPGMTGARCLALCDHCGSAAAALDAPTDAWDAALAGLGGGRIPREAVELGWAGDQQDRLCRLGGRLLTLADTGYPVLLRHTADPPLVLFVLGRLDLNLPCVAIVGPRRASTYGLTVAGRLACELARSGLCVVSGMAAGVDSAAHRGALEAGGPTIAVLGCGADVPYPAGHRELHAQIRDSGAVVSELPMGSPPARGSFPRRNRLVSGLCLGVVLVETPVRSGALITARWAQEQGRDLMVVPGSVLDGRSDGGHRLASEEDARVVTSAADVVRQLSHWSTGPQPVAGAPDRGQVWAPAADRTQAHGRLSPVGQRLFAALGAQPQHVDTLGSQCALRPSDVLGALLELEMEGLVARLQGQRYVRVSP